MSTLDNTPADLEVDTQDICYFGDHIDGRRGFAVLVIAQSWTTDMNFLPELLLSHPPAVPSSSYLVSQVLKHFGGHVKNLDIFFVICKDF